MRVVTLIIAVVFGGVVMAQGPGQPPGAPGRGQRPPRATPQRADAPRGTAVLKGQIITADDGQPIRRAQVRINSPGVREGRLATTDAQGRFEIRELPAGRYSMTASKGGFVSLQFGQRRPLESGTPIELGDGQTIDKIVIALPRGSVLGGRITDEFGEPVANAVVMAWRYGYAAGTRRLMPTQAANSRDTTDDQGHYRLFGLPPGDYVVSAMLRGGGPEVTDPMGELSGYASTYYPGTSDIGEAARVTLAVSQEHTGVNFGLIATRLSRVSGQVIMSDGAPATAGAVALVPTNASGGRAVVMQQGGAGNRIDGSGAFRMTNVAPGRYQLQARAGGREFEMARMDLTVGNDDVDGLTLVTAPAAAISGSIVSDTGEPFDFRPQQVQITVRPVSPEGQGMPGGGAGGLRVADDWTFTVRSVSDAVLVRASAPQGWTLKSVVAGGEDITDRPVEFAPGQTTAGVQITLTKKMSALTGLVTDTRGNPVLDAAVVVFPADEKLWTFQSRFIKAARPDQEGKYRIMALPSADYLIVALQALEDGQAGDPEFLASIKEAAARFDLAEGETKAVDVKLAAQK
ncbi:MAG TPA: carboxypeptidase regulatory-like domain-containing protein [Vicinamibacterales bacterium]|nr:carboxypeptidase regulatory-like domain-containing protein [Vicinamibacterales bacterium]